jgi:hypothetical protein
MRVHTIIFLGARDVLNGNLIMSTIARRRRMGVTYENFIKPHFIATATSCKVPRGLSDPYFPDGFDNKTNARGQLPRDRDTARNCCLTR